MGARASNQIFLIAVTLVATRYLTPADFGMFAIATAFITLSRTLLYAGPFEYLLKAPDLDRSASECLVVNAMMASASAIVLVGLAAAAPLLFNSTGVAALMLMLAPSNFLAAFASWEEAQLLRSGRVQRYYLVTTLVEVASAALAVGLLVAGFGLIALAAQIYARLMLLAIIYRLMLVLPRWRRPAGAHVRTIARWSLSRYGTVTVSFLSNYSGDLILGALLSPAATGLYRASNRVVTAAADMFAQPAGIIAMSSLSARFAAGLRPDGHWLRIFSGIALLGWPALIGVALLADRLAPIMLGSQWTAAGPIIAILCLARMAGLLSSIASALLVAYDRQHRVFLIQLAASIAVAGLTIVLARFGVTGAAIAASVVAWASMSALLGSALALGGVKARDWREVCIVVTVPALATAAGAGIGRTIAPMLATSPIAQLGLAILAGAACWSIAAVLLRHQVLAALHTLGQRGVEPVPAR